MNVELVTCYLLLKYSKTVHFIPSKLNICHQFVSLIIKNPMEFQNIYVYFNLFKIHPSTL